MSGIRLHRPTPDPRRSDSGSALLLVMGIGFLAMSLVIVAAGYALSGYTATKRDLNANTAVGAAQAGIDDYISRLNDNELYWGLGNTDSTNPALSSWVTVPGSTVNAQYRYDVNASTIANDGLVRLRSSGRVGKEVRTVSASLRRGRFFDFVYFSDFETGDPNNPDYYTSSYWDTRDEAAICGRYNWQSGYNSRDANCPKIYWRNDDLIGPFHTNDTFFAAGSPTFQGQVTSGCPEKVPADACFNKNVWVGYDSTAAPNFYPCAGAPLVCTGKPIGGTVVPMPASNSTLRKEADKTQGGLGCLYTGPTRIVFKPDGKMSVSSPNTPATQNPCGTGPSQSPPPNGVIYVESIPASRTPPDCIEPWVTTPGTAAPVSLVLDATSAGPDYPLLADKSPWDCRAGDLFVEGTLKGQVTAATQNNIVLTGNLRYANGNAGRDILGLIAENNISVYHPVDNSNADLLTSNQMKDPEIWAALLSVNHSLSVQNYKYGIPRGDLRLRGSIAQKWRGAVGTFNGTTTSSGYSKDWEYDDRLKFLTPPKFLDPVSASWIPIEQSEGSPAY